MDRALIYQIWIRVRPFIWAVHRHDRIAFRQPVLSLRPTIPVPSVNYRAAELEVLPVQVYQSADDQQNHRKIRHRLVQKSNQIKLNHV